MKDCIRFLTDQSFRNIIKKNSNRLRQRSFNNYTSDINSDEKNELNNIKKINLKTNIDIVSENTRKNKKDLYGASYLRTNLTTSKFLTKYRIQECRSLTKINTQEQELESKFKEPKNKNKNLEIEEKKKNENKVEETEIKEVNKDAFKNTKPLFIKKKAGRISVRKQIKENKSNLSELISPKKNVYSGEIIINDKIKNLNNDINLNLSPGNFEINFVDSQKQLLDKNSKKNESLKCLDFCNSNSTRNFKVEFNSKNKILNMNSFNGIVPVQRRSGENSLVSLDNFCPKEEQIISSPRLDDTNSKTNSTKSLSILANSKNVYIEKIILDLIELESSMDNKTLFSILLNNLNKKYINSFDYELIKIDNNGAISDESKITSINIFYKLFSLIITCYIFFISDNEINKSLFKDKLKKPNIEFYSAKKQDSEEISEEEFQIKNILSEFIYNNILYLKKNDIIGNILKISLFKDKFEEQSHNKNNIKRYVTVYLIKDIVSRIIEILFSERLYYKPLYLGLKQVLGKIRSIKLGNLIVIIKETILYCYNNKNVKNDKPYIFSTPDSKQNKISIFNFPFNQKKNLLYVKPKNLTKDENPKISENRKNSDIPKIPYISSKSNKKYSLVLDMDETIVHSMKINNYFYYLCRPGLFNFLDEIKKYYEIIIFTSSPQIYADKILNQIDIYDNIFSHRLYKNHVTFENGKGVKNLRLIGRDLTKTIFVDNNKYNAKYNLKNLYLIQTWRNDFLDNELNKLKYKLLNIATSFKFDKDITEGL